METVGVRELKAHLSYHLRRVRSGARVVVTERGQAIATLEAVARPQAMTWPRDLVVEGRATWSGGKPEGAHQFVRTERNATLSSAVIEDRR